MYTYTTGSQVGVSTTEFLYTYTDANTYVYNRHTHDIISKNETVYTCTYAYTYTYSFNRASAPMTENSFENNTGYTWATHRWAGAALAIL